jgi:hypothetical protein
MSPVELVGHCPPHVGLLEFEKDDPFLKRLKKYNKTEKSVQSKTTRFKSP